MIIVGDIHGKVKKFELLLKNFEHEQVIQLGDFGFKSHHEWALKNHEKYNFKVLFGNHDYYPMVNEKHSLGEWGVQNHENSVVFWVRGAESIDKHLRTEGKDWFREEEIGYVGFMDILQHYENIKPEIMITHDCPSMIMEIMFGKESNKSITSQGLGAMFNIHQPKKWIFGHHHKSDTMMVNGCEFICLNELEYIKI